MGIPPIDRRQLLSSFEAPENDDPITPQSRGQALALSLLRPAAHNAYYPASRVWPKDAKKRVHDARVSCRRLVEILELLAPMLPKGGTRKAQRRAKTFRQALGNARETDVMKADLQRLLLPLELSKDTFHKLGHELQKHASEGISVLEAYPPERLIRDGIDVLALSHRAKDLSLSDVAGPHLKARAQAVLPFLLSVNDIEKGREQHRLRVKIKHLRYTVEILSDPYRDRIDGEKLIPVLKNLQDLLGDLNDIQDLRDWLDRAPLAELSSPAAAEAIRQIAQKTHAERFEEARITVLAKAPLLASNLTRVGEQIEAETSEGDGEA